MFVTSARSALVTSATLALLLVDPAFALRKITVINKCGTTVNVAAHSPGWASERPTKLDGTPQPGHWQLKNASPYSFNVPDIWTAGTLWVQGGCDEAGKNCKVGACGACDGTQAGAAGPTLAEFTLGTGANDAYDVSLVNGFNVPMAIKPTANCKVAECANDILASCPANAQYPQSGQALACMSACAMNPSPQVCCTGQYDGVGNCPSSGIPNYDLFKSACKNAYIYAKDDYPSTSQTAVWSCQTALKSNYEVILCPSGGGMGAA